MVESFRLGGTDTRCSRVGMGGCPLGGHGWGAVDDSEATRAVHEALERGVNLFDTADCYGLGHSESLLGEALGARRRDVVLATKFGIRWEAGGRTWKDSSPTYMREALEASLGRLRVDCIPLYYLHWHDGEVPLSEVVGALADHQREGKIRFIGLSNVDAEQLDAATEVANIAAVQVRGSLLRQAAFRRVVDIARDKGVSVLTWGSLAEGLLAGKFAVDTRFGPNDRRSRYEDFQSPRFERNLAVADEVTAVATRLGRTAPQVSLRWLLDTDGVAGCLFGAKRPAQVTDNVGALDWKLSKDDYDRLAEAARQVDAINE